MSCATQVASMSELTSRPKRHQRTDETEIPSVTRSSSVPIDPICGKAKRKLFEVDHEETKKILNAELSKIMQTQTSKYNFDFEKDVPLKGPGNYNWTLAPASTMPKAYRESVCGEGSSGSILSSSAIQPSLGMESNLPSTSQRSRADNARRKLPFNSKVVQSISFGDGGDESDISKRPNHNEVVEKRVQNNLIPTRPDSNGDKDSTLKITLSRVQQNSESTITGAYIINYSR